MGHSHLSAPVYTVEGAPKGRNNNRVGARSHGAYSREISLSITNHVDRQHRELREALNVRRSGEKAGRRMFDAVAALGDTQWATILGCRPLIFMTVGSMFPFDRLVRAMDIWAATHHHEKVVAQIGAGAYEPQHMDWTRKISPIGFRENIRNARLVVSHAGMGTVITAMEFRCPVVLLPRKATLSEVTTDHQLHTAEWLKDKPGIFVCADESDVESAIARAYTSEMPSRREAISVVPSGFTRKIRSFIGAIK